MTPAMNDTFEDFYISQLGSLFSNYNLVGLCFIIVTIDKVLYSFSTNFK